MPPNFNIIRRANAKSVTLIKEDAMRKILSICLAAVGFLMAPGVYAQYDSSGQDYSQNSNYNSNYQDQQHYSQEHCCGEPQEQPCGTAYCLYCKYEPSYYNEWRTICEPKVFTKKCCRYVPKEYEKCCVKYVPQYYTQTCCRYEPEYFDVSETRDVPRKICEQKVTYVPRYYYKQVCNPNAGTATYNSNAGGSACGPNGCPAPACQ